MKIIGAANVDKGEDNFVVSSDDPLCLYVFNTSRWDCTCRLLTVAVFDHRRNTHKVLKHSQLKIYNNINCHTLHPIMAMD